jgi:hypothetical protein
MKITNTITIGGIVVVFVTQLVATVLAHGKSFAVSTFF